MEWIDEDLDVAVEAVLDRRRAKLVRDAAYRRLVAKGWSTLKIERGMREKLLETGLTVKELARLGVSHDSVRHAVLRGD